MNASEYSKRVGIPDNCSIGSAPAFQRVQSTLVAVLNTHLGKFRMSHVVPSSSELDLLNAQLIELLELHPAFGKEARKERARRAMQLASRYVKPPGQPGASEGIIIKKDSHSSKGSEEDVGTHPNSQEEVQDNPESSSKLQEAKNLLAGILKRELNGSAAANGKSGDAPEHNASQESSMSGSSGLEEDAVVRYGNTQHRITNLLAQAIRKTQDSENNSLKEEKPGNTALSSVVQQIKDALQSETVNDALLRQTLASTVHSRKRKDRTEDDVAVRALMALNDATQETPSNVVA